jgi:hypothetical protein
MTLSLSISPMGGGHTFILEGRLPVTVARPTSIYKTRLYIEHDLRQAGAFLPARRAISVHT